MRWESGKLQEVRCRVARTSVALPTSFGNYIPFKSEILRLSFRACKQHALPNEIGIRILEKTPLMYLLRWLAYYAFICIVLMFVHIGNQHESLLKFFFGTPLIFRYFMLFGLLGVILVVWARKVSRVWPIRIDADADVVEIRFSDEIYAKDFRIANPLVTLKLLTDSPPFFCVPPLGKSIVLSLFWLLYPIWSKRRLVPSR